MTSTDDQLAQEKITAFWSTVAPGYEAHDGNVPRQDSPEHEAWVAAIADLLPPPPTDVLDIATGTGFVALTAAALGHRVTGLDASKAMLAEARAEAARRALNVLWVEGDAVAPPFEASTFDAVISRHFLWTLRQPVVAIGNWRRLLREGGRFVAIDGFWFTDGLPDEPAAEDLFGQHYTRETRAALPAMGWSTPEPAARMVASAGFADIAISRLSTVHAVAEQPPSTEPWYVLTARKGPG